jgi:hypothetical protein
MCAETDTIYGPHYGTCVCLQYRCADEKKERDVKLCTSGRLAAHKDSPQGRAFSSASDNIMFLRAVEIQGKDLLLHFAARTWRFYDMPPEIKDDLIKAVITVGMLFYQGPPRFRLPVSDKGVPLFDLSQYNYFVPPSDDQLCIENLPPGFERKKAPDGRFYFVDHANQATSWTLPANAMELIRLSQLRKYPKYMMDRGFFCSLRLWCLHDGYVKMHEPTVPYWSAPPSTGDQQQLANNTKEGKILHVDHLMKLLYQETRPKDLNNAFLPALKHALSYTKFFKGLRISRFALADNAHPDFMLILRAALPNLTMLDLSLGAEESGKKVQVLPLQKTTWHVSVSAVRHLPKTDLLGSCDPVSTIVHTHMYACMYMHAFVHVRALSHNRMKPTQ